MTSQGRRTLQERLRNPPPVPTNRGPWTLRELVGPPTTSVRDLPTLTLTVEIDE
jgi:hypothetical protein